MTKPRNPWAQLPEESHQAFRSFKAYLELGRARTMAAAYRLVYGKGPQAEAPHMIRNWATKYDWDRRARAYDDMIEGAAQEAEIKAAKAKAAKMAEERIGAYSNMLSAGRVIMAKANLGKLPERAARRMLSSAVRAIDTGARGQRLELGEPDPVQRQEISGPGGKPIALAVSGQLAVNTGEMMMRLSGLLAGMEPGERTALLNDIDSFLVMGQRLTERLLPAPALDGESGGQEEAGDDK